jgi:hypothetical protein
VAGECAGASLGDAPTIPGASQPDWGPANVLTGNPPTDPNNPTDPGSDAACAKAKEKVAKAKAKLKKAKESGKERRIERAKAKLKKAKEAKKEACA